MRGRSQGTMVPKAVLATARGADLDRHDRAAMPRRRLTLLTVHAPCVQHDAPRGVIVQPPLAFSAEPG
jgi:hypothetical protein